MHKLLIGACVAALVSGTAVAQQHFAFTDQMHDYSSQGPGLVTGSFDGTLNGNVITNLSNISVFIDGAAFNGNGALFSGHSTGSDFASGGATASLDGTQNDFLFIDSNYPSNLSYSNYYFSTSSLTQGVAYSFNNGRDAENYFSMNFRAQAVPEPASWALLVGGFGLVGGAMRSRRKAEVSFG